MGIKRIRIKNILSFDEIFINDFSDINCIVGKNNVGKSNLLKALDYFYKQLKGDYEKPLPLKSSYSSYGEICISFDTNRLEGVIRSNKNKSSYQKHIYNSLFKSEKFDLLKLLLGGNNSKKGEFSLTLRLNRDNSILWLDSDKDVRDIICRVYPFFFIDTRRMDLYNWKYLWDIVSKLKFINTKKLSRNDIVDFFDNSVSSKSSSYRDYIKIIDETTKASPYDYQDIVFNYIKVGLSGHNFNIDGFDLGTQSDGTNSYKFLEIFLSLIISLTRREFITPTVFIDEPEIGLHPKRCEELIEKLSFIYRKFEKTSERWERGKYSTPYPIIIISTHSPSILKAIVKLFHNFNEHKIFHFISNKKKSTECTIMKSYFDDPRFLNVFSDNEARLFFSNFILFVEGETELELFGNPYLKEMFPELNRIDVYKTNEVMLNAVKPSNSNVSIPYLVLYDADKMISVDKNDGAIVFTEREVNIYKIKDRFRRAYWGSPERDNQLRLSNIISLNKVPNELSGGKSHFKKLNSEDLIKRINKVISKTDGLIISPTTTEGYLINANNIKIFLKWLHKEYCRNLKPGIEVEPNQFIDNFRNGYPGTYDAEQCFKSIFKSYPLTASLTVDNKNFCNEIKRRYRFIFIQKLQSNQFTEREFLNVLRLCFEGKTDTLVSIDNDSYKFIDKRIRDAVSLIMKDFIKKLPHKGKKTGGWVSSFINYAISDLAKRSKDDTELRVNFKYAFPDLSSIISEISSSIE